MANQVGKGAISCVVCDGKFSYNLWGCVKVQVRMVFLPHFSRNNFFEYVKLF
jgi:hypothetical protein